MQEALLQYKKKYLNVDDLRTLRYGRVMIMTDQDQVTIPASTCEEVDAA